MKKKKRNSNEAGDSLVPPDRNRALSERRQRREKIAYSLRLDWKKYFIRAHVVQLQFRMRNSHCIGMADRKRERERQIQYTAVEPEPMRRRNTEAPTTDAHNTKYESKHVMCRIARAVI